jgi:hypothetical protein
MAAALVLCLFAFVVLAAGEARAAEQPSQTQTLQQGKVESTTVINGTKVAEPVPDTTTPRVVPPPAEKPAAEDPAPPPPRNETPPAKEPSPPPIDPAPSTPEPEVTAPQPTPRPEPQWFPVKTDGEVVESAPVLDTSQSATDFGRGLEPKPMSNASPNVIDPAPAPTAPAAADDGYASGPTPDPVLPVPGPAAASEHVLPAASGLTGLVRGLVADPVAPRGDGGPLPQSTLLEELKEAPSWALATELATTLLGTGPESAAPAKNAPASNAATAAPAASLTPLAPVPTVVPASMGGALRLPSSVGTTVAGAVGTVRSAAASVATEVLGSLAGGSPGTSSTDATNVPQEKPSEGTPQQQPAPPLAPPVGGGGSYSPSTGGGQLGTGWGSAPLLVGILALTAAILLRRDFRTYLISCEMPKPSSALLLPLERPG